MAHISARSLSTRTVTAALGAALALAAVVAGGSHGSPESLKVHGASVSLNSVSLNSVSLNSVSLNSVSLNSVSLN